MRGFYEAETRGADAPPTSDERVRLFLQLAVLAFWTPCAGADLFLLWQGHGRDSATGLVFWLLFRQALVFLALWFTAALAQGLLVGRRTPAEPRRKRSRRSDAPIRTAQSAGVTLGRGNRGL